MKKRKKSRRYGPGHMFFVYSTVKLPGNRTLMMDAGNIILDIAGEERRGLTVDDLLRRFKAGVGRALDNDRMLLS